MKNKLPGESPVFSSCRLPWNNSLVQASGNLHEYFAALVGEGAENYLPQQIAFFYDPEISESIIQAFFSLVAVQLDRELRNRRVRSKVFVESGLMSSSELSSFLTAHRSVQPWAIYYSLNGGLGIPDEESSNDSYASWGVMPCSTMRNHGVAWHRSASGQLNIWLATARKHGLEWDWDSDIGHESAHAAFAPVPLFVQPLNDGQQPPALSNVRAIGDLTPAHLARICYLFSEIAVVAVRGETRPTETCLPVADRDELFALLALTDELIPGSGIDEALRSCCRVDGVVHPNEGFEIFEIAAPIMRLIPKLSSLVGCFYPPNLKSFREAMFSRASSE